MDIDVSQLPELAVDAVERRHESVRVVRDGRTVATVVPAELSPVERPVFQSHKSLRTRMGRLVPDFATLLREERDGR